MNLRIVGGVCAALCVAAGAARADVITYENSPLGGPPLPPLDRATFTPGLGQSGPVFESGVIVDDGTGNHALSLSPLSLNFHQFNFINRTFDATTQYDWQTSSIQVLSTQNVLYNLVHPNGTSSTGGTLVANQWTTFVGNFDYLQFTGPGNILVDNVTFSLVRTTPVPEPATWAMLISGLGLVGAAMRRRRTAMAAA
jgi:hypothetical protein